MSHVTQNYYKTERLYCNVQKRKTAERWESVLQLGGCWSSVATLTVNTAGAAVQRVMDEEITV